jgi:hypothetical protein
MQHQDWRRFLPDRSQLMLLVMVVIVLAAGMSFVNLGIARNNALATNRAAHARYEEAVRQNELLNGSLAAVQREENVVPKAFDYFKWSLPGTTTIVLEPAEAGTETEGEQSLRPTPPFWGQWWRRLVNP